MGRTGTISTFINGGQVGWSSVANWYQEGVRCLQDVAELKKRWEDLHFVKRAKIC